MTAACTCCACRGGDHPADGWQPYGMLGPHPVETCPTPGCTTFAIRPADDRDLLGVIVDRLDALGCRTQPIDVNGGTA